MEMKRSSSNAMVAGVCGGLAEHFDTDATLVRVIFVVGTILTGIVPGLLVYLILMLLMDQS